MTHKAKTKSCYLCGNLIKCFEKISRKMISAKLSDKTTEVCMHKYI